MMWKICLIYLLIICFIGAELHSSGEITEEEFLNFTKQVSYDNLNFTHFTEKGNDQNETFVSRLVYKSVDLYIFVTTGGVSEAIKYGWENPQYNYDIAWKLLFVSLFAAFIIPLLYLILFVGYFIKLLVQIIKKRRGKTK